MVAVTLPRVGCRHERERCDPHGGESMAQREAPTEPEIMRQLGMMNQAKIDYGHTDTQAASAKAEQTESIDIHITGPSLFALSKRGAS